MDAADHAELLEQQQRDRAIARHRTLSGQPPATRAPCVDCGGPIPDIRRDILPHTTVCTDCAHERERHWQQDRV